MADAITVQCPSCDSSFPVDPAKVPEGGVRARCSECSDIFRVEAPSAPAWEPAEETPSFETDEDTPSFEEADDAPSFEEAEDTPSFEEADDAPSFETTEEPSASTADETPSFEPNDYFFSGGGVAKEEAPVEESVEEEAPSRPTFGSRTPEQKAERLARVLVSDMITYNPQMYERAVGQGTLREEFAEEIEKSWEEYVDQVGKELAESTTYWKDALNDILAKGDPLF